MHQLLCADRTSIINESVLVRQHRVEACKGLISFKKPMNKAKCRNFVSNDLYLNRYVSFVIRRLSTNDEIQPFPHKTFVERYHREILLGKVNLQIFSVYNYSPSRSRLKIQEELLSLIYYHFNFHLSQISLIFKMVYHPLKYY